MPGYIPSLLNHTTKALSIFQVNIQFAIIYCDRQIHITVADFSKKN
jgi:hypothetical protein